MLEGIPFSVIIGTVFGFLAGIGVGGGSLLMLWLTLIIDMPHQEARIINLLFFIPSAIIASLFQMKHGSLHFRKIVPAIIGGTIGAILFAFWGKEIDRTLLRKLFGVLFLITGLRELFYKPRKA